MTNHRKYLGRAMHRQPFEVAIASVAVLTGFTQTLGQAIPASVTEQPQVVQSLFALTLLIGGLLTLIGFLSRTPSCPDKGQSTERVGLWLLTIAFVVYAVAALGQFNLGAFAAAAFYIAMGIAFLVRAAGVKHDVEVVRALAGERHSHIVKVDESE